MNANEILDASGMNATGNKPVPAKPNVSKAQLAPAGGLYPAKKCRDLPENASSGEANAFNGIK